MTTRFRAFDSESTFRMYKPEEVWVCDDVAWIIDNDSWDEELVFNNNLIIMQSTGLTDKNGKEIFEGDIVKLFDKDLYVVEWSSQEASYKLIPVDKQWSDCYFSNYENITKIIEVVGNIWEDGELLDS